MGARVGSNVRVRLHWRIMDTDCGHRHRSCPYDDTFPGGVCPELFCPDDIGLDGLWLGSIPALMPYALS